MKTYIQIGSNKGNDDFQRIIEFLEEKSRIILIEPNSSLIEDLIKNYQNLIKKNIVIICNKAISIKNEITKLYLYDSCEHSSLIKRKSHIIPKREINIESITFEELCKIYNINEIELLLIDTEGLDYEIINSIDFSKISIKKLIFEKWNYHNDDLNEKYKTGEDFLEKEIKEKLQKLYHWNTINMGGMTNYELTKISNIKV